MVSLIDKDLLTNKIQVISIASPMIAKLEDGTNKVLGTILWEIDFN